MPTEAEIKILIQNHMRTFLLLFIFLKLRFKIYALKHVPILLSYRGEHFYLAKKEKKKKNDCLKINERDLPP